MLATVVDTKELWQTVVFSFVAGVGATGLFSVLIFGAARSAELRRADRHGLAAAAGALSLVALVAMAAAIVLGIIVMTTK